MSRPAVRHHLAPLRRGSIIAPRRQGENNHGLAEGGVQPVALVRDLIV